MLEAVSTAFLTPLFTAGLFIKSIHPVLQALSPAPIDSVRWRFPVEGRQQKDLGLLGHLVPEGGKPLTKGS